MMLKYLGEKKWANSIDNSVYAVLEEAKVLTPDLGGRSKTTDVTDRIIEKLDASAHA